MIWAGIDELEELERRRPSGDSDGPEHDIDEANPGTSAVEHTPHPTDTLDEVHQLKRVIFGSKLKKITLAQVEADHSTPPPALAATEVNILEPNIIYATPDFTPAFRDLRRKINKGLANVLASKSNAGVYPRVSLPPDHMVCISNLLIYQNIDR